MDVIVNKADVTEIKNKPIKIHIRPSTEIKGTNKENQIAKSRSLLIRAYLVKLGISHNRIKIEIDEKNINTENQIILSFIEI